MAAGTEKKPAQDGKKPRNTEGLRRGGGRPKGSVNKVTAEVRTLAQEHGPDAIEVLVYLMHKARSERSRIAAATELLDRAYGKSAASVDHTSDGKPLPGVPGGVLVVPASMSVEDWEKLAAKGEA
ncbi:hypothetical protein [Castellaniella caeni]|uniref:hypothetical protein n=1 Tax=Castellaniella caeni TaxID=266123 RepID=UPI000C9F1993|nr:hypothetical protein [Castellaniella caeni]